jgi:hypothetical protein
MLLSATNTYAFATVISAGTLALSGNGTIKSSSNIIVRGGATLDVSGVTAPPYTLVSGQTLSGNGSIHGKLTVGGSAALAPGASIGMLTFDDDLTLHSNAWTRIEVNQDAGTNDFIAVGGVLTYGGSLIVANVSGELQVGNSFVIAGAGTPTGNFKHVFGSPGAGLAWSFDPASGILSVVEAPPSPVLNFEVSGTTLIFSWTNAVTLQWLTNGLSAGISADPTQWLDYPGGSTSPVTYTNNPSIGCAFFRLINP